MTARTGKVRPKIGFHGPIAMSSMRRRALAAVARNREVIQMMRRQQAAAYEQMKAIFSHVREGVGMEDPSVKSPKVH